MVPARPRGQTALSAARNLPKLGAPLSRGGRRMRHAWRGTSCARICIVGALKFCRFQAAERAVWPVGR
eukprot:4100541-Alexandrium_andersonii.AAC.1